MLKTKKTIFDLLSKIFLVYLAILKDYYDNCVRIYINYGK